MAQHIRDMMTPNPVSLPGTDAIVMEEHRVCGIVTDRDMVVRTVAEAQDLTTTTLADICSHQRLLIVAPTDSVEQAVRRMRLHAVRRIPVVEAGGKAVGIVSLGDLAVERDPDSALGGMSAAPPDA